MRLIVFWATGPFASAGKAPRFVRNKDLTPNSMAEMFRCLQVLAVLPLLAIAMCTGTTRTREDLQPTGDSSASRASFAAPSGDKVGIKGIVNFGEVTPALFRRERTHQGFEALATGIDIIVDLRGNRNNSEGKRCAALVCNML